MKTLRAFAVLFALLAVSDFLKPVLESGQTGFVFLGRRLSDTPNMIAATAFGVFLVCYASALWRRSAAALPLGLAYAGYVTANLFLFTLRQPAPTGNEKIFGILYMIFALGGAWGAVWAMVREGFAHMDPAPGRIVL